VSQNVKLRVGKRDLKSYPVLGSVVLCRTREGRSVDGELVKAPLSPPSEYDIETHESDLIIDEDVVGGGGGNETSAASNTGERRVESSEG
jgi:hypothetical protein